MTRHSCGKNSTLKKGQFRESRHIIHWSGLAWRVKADIVEIKVLAIEGAISLDAAAQTWPITSTIAVKVASRSKGLHRRLDQPTQNGKPISADVANLQIRYAPIEIRCKFDKWSVASTQHIQEGIEYISKITKKPELGPGPDKCTRVSCSWNASIWLCNDVSFLRSFVISSVPSSHQCRCSLLTIIRFLWYSHPPV